MGHALRDQLENAWQLLVPTCDLRLSNGRFSTGNGNLIFIG
jgi:hypothetical protein